MKVSYCLTIIFILGMQFSAVSTFADAPVVKTAANFPNITREAYGLKPSILNLALEANISLKKKNIQKNIITIIDYSLPSAARRFWVLDLRKDKVLFSTRTTHGQGSGDSFAFKFSDVPNSHKSSIGVFVTGDTYYGKHGKSLELFGMEPGFNANAHKRRIVIHKANYVTDSFVKQFGKAGRSWGCPALCPAQTERIINKIKNGSMVFSYYPDPTWLGQSRYINN